MNLLMVHQNFPAQFRHLAPALAREGHRVVALCMSRVTPGRWLGVEIVPYQPNRSSSGSIHPWLADFETQKSAWLRMNRDSSRFPAVFPSAAQFRHLKLKRQTGGAYRLDLPADRGDTQLHVCRVGAARAAKFFE